jgi:hypothetical protein
MNSGPVGSYSLQRPKDGTTRLQVRQAGRFDGKSEGRRKAPDVTTDANSVLTGLPAQKANGYENSLWTGGVRTHFVG